MHIIGVDLGGTKILGIRANEEGEIAQTLRVDTQGGEGLEAVVDRMAKMVRDLTPSEGEVAAVGVGAPGPLNPWKGIVYNPPNLPGWETVPLRDMLRARLDLPDSVPVAVANDANAAGLAEYLFGAGCERHLGRRIEHLVYLTVSTGIGGGVITGGKLLLGADGMAGELGHMVIQPDGPHCYCGGIGCFEALASGTALAREAEIVVGARKETIMDELAGGDPEKVTAEIVAEAAARGDREALKLMEREGYLVGLGVVNCIHLFNPQLVVIGGGLTGAGDLLFNPVRATAAERVMPGYRGSYEIVPAALGKNTGALGAVAAALQEL